MNPLEELKYPIGKYTPPDTIKSEHINFWIDELFIFPTQLSTLAIGLDDYALAKKYRPDGWTVTQVIHHLADSHINAYTRFHLTLTEEKPMIRPYFEERWAELQDGKRGDVSFSIEILKAIHTRLVFLLRSLDLKDFERTYIHPETQKEYTMAYLLGNYAWHGQHHLAHIKLTL